MYRIGKPIQSLNNGEIFQDLFPQQARNLGIKISFRASFKKQRSGEGEEEEEG